MFWDLVGQDKTSLGGNRTTVYYIGINLKTPMVLTIKVACH